MTDVQAWEPTARGKWFAAYGRWIAPLVLVWLALPARQIAERETSAARALSLIVLGVFGGCFIWVAITMSKTNTAQPTPVTWLCAAVMLATTIVMPRVHPDITWTCLQAYFTISLTFILPLSVVPRTIAVCALLAVVQDSSLDHDFSDHVSSTFTLLGLSVAAFGVRRSRDLVQRLQAAQGQVARLAAVEERLRIARDLHDLVGHSLSLIVVKSELAGRLADTRPKAAASEIADVESVARQSLVQVRDAVTGYRQRSLLEEVDGARSALAAADVQATVRLADTPPPEEIDRLLGWVVREGVINVIRHARATHCAITVSRDEQAVTLDIVDDGRGPSGGPGEGNGLAGLAERVSAAGGRIESGARREQSGFRLSVSVPLAPLTPQRDDSGEHPEERPEGKLAER